MGDSPIFHDPSGRRAKLTVRVLASLVAVIAVGAVVLGLTLVAVPVPPPLQINMEHPRPRPLLRQVNHLKAQATASLSAVARPWLPRDARAARIADGRRSIAAFYVPWDEASKASLRAHVGDIDWLAPVLATVTGPDHRLYIYQDPGLPRLIASSPHQPRLLPVIQNAKSGKWDGEEAAALLRSPRARARLLDQLIPLLRDWKASGVVFDFESLPAEAQADYKAFLKLARGRLSKRGLSVSLAVPVDDPDWRPADYAKVADHLFLMVYDEHAGASAPGPIASQAWFVSQTMRALQGVPRDKATIAVGSYALNWSQGQAADPLTVEEAWLAARDSGAPILFDPASGNPTFGYVDADGTTHQVWMLDAATVWNQLKAVARTGAPQVALWRLGSEDAGVWDVMRNFKSGAPVHLNALTATTNVDIEGTGEILRIESTPSPGRREFRFDRAGLIRDERYAALPNPYVVRRTGAKPKRVALTFDDGPDPRYTPKVLDILKAKKATATFFLIGENALSHPGLTRRILAEGNEIGNHSYTHPNMALEPDGGIRLEINATQRVIEAYTGHATRLFRAPYLGDAEPTTADELDPALDAQDAGYLNVGLHVDPGDWRKPGAQAIVARTLAQVQSASPLRSENVILLHDSGGDRSQTVAALPGLIDALRARGYTLVNVSDLAGLSREAVMPEVKGWDLLAVQADVALFGAIAAFNLVIRWLFFVAILLGVARAILLTALAILNRRQEVRGQAPAMAPDAFVSVIIPAFNEAKVIAASIRRVLASKGVQLDVIVVDDGSKDETSAVVSRAFGEDARVRLLTIANGGKARALNRGLALARAEIVVSLDADTQFEPETIARLARWFADPELGAVAGNAKVGNPVNLVTRWQAVEYVTAQNLERRALARFDAMTVVPGAVGAWRKAATAQVGGYPADTLAEDQDLTIAIQRAGWTVAYDIEAVAWTEAPDSFAGLARQRFRWAFGTLQCLWKHRAVIATGRPQGLGWVGLPQAWLFQIGFAMISPVIDLAVVVSLLGLALRVQQHGWAQAETDAPRMLLYWLAFAVIDLLSGWVAYRLEPREGRFPALLLLAQRFVYRQIMYSVVIRAVHAAFSGPQVGWGKLKRTGIQLADAPAAQPRSPA